MTRKMRRKIDKSEQTAGLLMEYILDSGLNPGDRLPSEEELANRFNVSRVSIREALQGLKFMGLLDSKPRRGTIVTEPDFQKLNNYMRFQLAFCPMSYEQLLEARASIELGHLDMVIEKIDSDSLSILQKAAEDCRRLDDSVEEQKRSANADLQFHRLLLEIGDNPALLAFSRLLENFFRLLKDKPGNLEQNRRTVDEHLQLLDLLKAGDIDQARYLMKQHLLTHYRQTISHDKPNESS